jgi:hypothetical protein
LDGKDVYIGVFIGNYDKGGHIIDLNITIHDGGEASRIPTKVIPLFNTLNIMEMAGQDYGTMFDSDNGLIVNLELTDTVRNASLRYITTVLVDGAMVMNLFQKSIRLRSMEKKYGRRFHGRKIAVPIACIIRHPATLGMAYLHRISVGQLVSGHGDQPFLDTFGRHSAWKAYA